jgi:glucose-1-phosphate thymidylyltransferase
MLPSPSPAACPGLPYRRDFVAGEPSALILGDNIFTATACPKCRAAPMRAMTARPCSPIMSPIRNATAWSSSMPRSARISIEEKPPAPRSNWAITGLYFYDERVVDFAHRIAPSPRGELEITDVNRLYLEQGALNVELMGRGYAWLDTGTHASLLEAAHFTQVIEERQGLKICCPEEIAWNLGMIDDAQLLRLAEPLSKSGYGTYLLRLLEQKKRA